ncbi:6102_t:CDS:2 [Cetraspora pellucida]|uniref:6102_t:CDS:1 n=1 Tax=Cetraspora pellucida TaxID=1433469 RepID=A0A9N9HMR2_9GLOM|nr:6102_t:CDS:2 [Cetraspora pellucida]
MSNNFSNHQSQENTESNSENSIEQNVNLDALQKSASNVFHIQCTSIQEFNEGGFHKVYILKIEDGKEYIGRVAFSVYSQWKTESEVAVMEYIHLNSNIPVPKVYYWNSFVNNPVGAEYILMEYLPGIRLCDIWTILSTMERGPFDTTNEYISAVIRNQILYNYIFKSIEQQKYWISKYEELYKLVPKYFLDEIKSMFVLMHKDFHLSNILVNDDKITGVINWECSGAFLMKCLCIFPVWIINNQMIEPTSKKSKKNVILQKFFHDEMSHHNPDFIRIFDNINIDEEKKILFCSI